MQVVSRVLQPLYGPQWFDEEKPKSLGKSSNLGSCLIWVYIFVGIVGGIEDEPTTVSGKGGTVVPLVTPVGSSCEPGGHQWHPHGIKASDHIMHRIPQW